VKKTGLDPRYDEENKQALNNPGESANSIKSTTKRSQRHPPSITPLKQYIRRSQITFVEGGNGDRN
jgi:hypothetical protein